MHTIPTQHNVFSHGNSLKIAMRIFALFDQPKIGVLMTAVQPVLKNVRIWKVPGWLRLSLIATVTCLVLLLMLHAFQRTWRHESLGPFFQGWPMCCSCQKVGCVVFWWRVHKGGLKDSKWFATKRYRFQPYFQHLNGLQRCDRRSF